MPLTVMFDVSILILVLHEFEDRLDQLIARLAILGRIGRLLFLNEPRLAYPVPLLSRVRAFRSASLIASFTLLILNGLLRHSSCLLVRTTSSTSSASASSLSRLS